MYFTEHAIRRFRAHSAPGFSYSAALRELIVLSATCAPIRQKAKEGDLQFQVTDGQRIIFVCKREPHPGTDGLVCVTVLPEPEAEVGDVDPLE
jgi:hypothetical protein